MLKISAIPSEIWTERAKDHTNLVGPFADAFLKRRSIGQTHAVEDFLFTYYSFSPTKLKQWVPSVKENLIFSDTLFEAYPWLFEDWFLRKENILSLNTKRFYKNVSEQASFIAKLCSNILTTPPRFGCFGLHEWAMVYKQSHEELRHRKHNLRLSQEELAAFVESQTLCCTHYDAFRFFTEKARPLNILNPRLETRLQMEQGGCIHANMDLYKWSSKLWPWIGSDFIAKTFLIALEARELDMRASPYDLKEEGYLPICIETEEGRKQYQREQQRLAEKATPLRHELHAFCLSIKDFGIDRDCN